MATDRSNPIHRPDGLVLGWLLLVGLAAPLPAAAQLTAVDDSYTVQFGQTLTVPAPGVLENETGNGREDSDAGAAVAVLDTPPLAHSGTFTLHSDGSFTYTHDGTASTTDSFTYHAENNVEVSNVATVTLQIAGVPAIEVSDDSFQVAPGGTLDVAAPGVLGNDGGGDVSGLTATLLTAPTSHSGTFTLGADGAFVYTHDGSATTSDSFTYEATDGSLTGQATATITIGTDTGDGGGSTDDTDGGGGGATDDTDGGGGDGTTGAASFSLDFEDVSLASASSSVGSQVRDLLQIRAPASAVALVVSTSGFTSFPTTTESLWVETADAQFTAAAREIFRECRRAALLAQARPEKYRLRIVLDLASAGSVTQADERAIKVALPDGLLDCRLERTEAIP